MLKPEIAIDLEYLLEFFRSREDANDFPATMQAVNRIEVWLATYSPNQNL